MRIMIMTMMTMRLMMTLTMTLMMTMLELSHTSPGPTAQHRWLDLSCTNIFLLFTQTPASSLRQDLLVEDPPQRRPPQSV